MRITVTSVILCWAIMSVQMYASEPCSEAFNFESAIWFKVVGPHSWIYPTKIFYLLLNIKQ